MLSCLLKIKNCEYTASTPKRSRTSELKKLGYKQQRIAALLFCQDVQIELCLDSKIEKNQEETSNDLGMKLK